jgi:hypothetical protein
LKVRSVATLSALDVGNVTLTDIDFMPSTGVSSVTNPRRLTAVADRIGGRRDRRREDPA